ncbi:MAG: AraC family transcriptional regulator [Panacagrimonas sp.]
MADSGEEKDSVSIWFVRQALMGLKPRSIPLEPLLSAAGIPLKLLESEQSRVSARSFGALWLGIAARLDDEFFGLDSRRMKVGSFALLCRSTVQASSLQHALALAIQFFNILLDDSQLELADDAGDAVIRVLDRADSSRPEPFRVFAHETALIMLHGLMCWLIGRRIPILLARFAYPRPPWWHEYLSMYSTELAFDCPSTEIRFGARLLQVPVIQTEATAREFLREAPHNFIVKFKDPKSFQARIRQRLRTTSPEVWPGFVELAAGFDMASSTLHRKLEQEGTSFRDIKDDLRRDLAIDRLAHSEVSVAQIAGELGFAEPSAFHRAFKLWTGLRPGDYRQRSAAERP